mmetsp:Transcript_50774/g.162551  ORF Transcript_50774/g.162551 Transcript_50774/m.162551 type:complete len:330 (+) Transcript_50774:1376-2365(+)
MPGLGELLHRLFDLRDEVLGDLLLLLLLRLVPSALGILALGVLALALARVLPLGGLGVLGHHLLHHHRGRVEDGLGAAVLLVGELGVLACLGVAVLHEPLVDLVLDGLAHLLPLHLPHLLLDGHQGLLVLGAVLALDVLAPHQIALLPQLGVGQGVPGGRLHPDEDQLRLRHVMNALPRQESARQALDADGGLLGRDAPQPEVVAADVERLLRLDAPHDARTLPALPPALVHLDAADGLLLAQGGQLRERRLVRRHDLVLVHQRLEELLAVLQLLGAVLHKVPRHGDLEHVWGELQVHQDVVQVNEVQPVVELLHEPVLDLQDAPHGGL